MYEAGLWEYNSARVLNATSVLVKLTGGKIVGVNTGTSNNIIALTDGKKFDTADGKFLNAFEGILNFTRNNTLYEFHVEPSPLFTCTYRKIRLDNGTYEGSYQYHDVLPSRCGLKNMSSKKFGLVKVWIVALRIAKFLLKDSAYSLEEEPEFRRTKLRVRKRKLVSVTTPIREIHSIYEVA